jgi:putative transposase
MSVAERRAMIKPSHAGLSVVRQCALVRLSRSGFYHQPRGQSAATLALLRQIDEVFLEHSFYGARQMMLHLRRLGQRIGRHRVRRLMAKMGLAPIYQKPRTSLATSATQGLSVFAARSGDHASQPGLVR